MVYFYQLFLNTDDVILKSYTSLCQKAKCTLFVWSTVHSGKMSPVNEATCVVKLSGNVQAYNPLIVTPRIWSHLTFSSNVHEHLYSMAATPQNHRLCDRDLSNH